MKPFLTEARAAARALSVLPGVKYNVFLELNAGASYTGIGHYLFQLKDKDHVFIDFSGRSIDFLELNSHIVPKSQIGMMWLEGALNLPQDLLRIGDNSLVLKFHNDYYNDGNGLHSCIDTDGKQYIYTQTEPYWTNRIFPVFDQPDIKGHLNFQVACPKEWNVITNTSYHFKGSGTHFFSHNPHSLLEELIFQDYSYVLNKEDVEYYAFKPTPLLSTYLFGFVAGPYKEIPLDEKQVYNNIPMSIYCRESLYEYATKQTNELFMYAIEGIKFYNEFFKVPFPFEKFDFVFCPEYTVGAMEYPGVITFNDYYLFREVPSSVRVTRRGETIVHELAHMWFGNLVTMKWWNDLWLNESFADFSSYLCNAFISKNLPFKTIDSWTSFQLNKFWGYNEDQAQTTHPIACVVESTEKADSIFDGITYSKGAAVLKQLYFLIGHENFSKNIGIYFNKYKWSNATLKDFIKEMDQSTEESDNMQNFIPLDLDLWNEMWIQTAGLNEIQVKWDSNQTGPSKLTLVQSAVLEAHPTLRYHKLKVAFINQNGEIAEVKDVIVENKPETVIEFDNKGYKAIFPNYEDWAYIKVSIDQTSLDFFMENFDKINSPLTQLLIIRSLFEMVRDAKMRSDRFVDFFLDKYIEQSIDNVQLFDSIIGLVHEALYRYSPKSVKVEHSTKLFDRLQAMLTKEKDFEKAQLITKKMISFALNDKSIEVLRKIFDEKIAETNPSLGVEDRWDIITSIYGSKAYDLAEKEAYFKKMEETDKSDLMKEKKFETSAMIATLEQRQGLWEFFLDKHKTISYTDLAASMQGFFSFFVGDELKKPFYDSYFEHLPSVLKSHTKEFAKTFLIYGRPDVDDVQPMIENYLKVFEHLDEKNEFFNIMIRKIIDGLQRKKKALDLYK